MIGYIIKFYPSGNIKLFEGTQTEKKSWEAYAQLK